MMGRVWMAVAGAAMLATAGCGGGGGAPVGPALTADAMERTCAGAAARAFGVSPLDVLVFPVGGSGAGQVAGGQAALPGGAIGTFQCSFGRNGAFEGITRTF